MTHPPTLWPDNGARERAREILRILDARPTGGWESGMVHGLIRELSQMAAGTVEYQTLFDLAPVHGSDEDPVDALEKALAQWDPSVRSDRGTPTRYKFYIPLEIVLNRNRVTPTQFYVWGQRFFFRSKQSVEGDIDGDLDESVLIPLEERGRRTVPPTIVTCVVESALDHNIWSRTVAEPFSVLRGLLELATADLSVRPEFQIDYQSIAVAPHPQNVMRISETGRQTGITFRVPATQQSYRHTLYQEQIDEMRRLGQGLTSPVKEGTTESVASTALDLYATAMDAAFDDNAFLSLWQCAEILVHSDNIRGSPARVARRINWVLEQQKNEAFRLPQTLKYLGNIRNPLVHEGRRELVKARDVNALKSITERLLRWYLLTAIDRFDRRADLEARYLRIV